MRLLRYFLLRQHAAYTHAPCLINWFQVFDARKIRPETAREIPYRSLIEIRPVSYTHLDVYKRQVYCLSFYVAL